VPGAVLLKRAGFAAEIGGKGRNFPAATFKYADPSTELPVVRLTDPAHTSILPASYNRPISKHNFMLYASDVTGRFEVFRMDLKNGQSRQLTDAENLDPHSLALLADNHGFCYIDGDRVMESNISSMHAREVYRLPTGFESGGLSVAEDGLFAVVIEKAIEKPIEKNTGRYRLQLVNIAKGGAVTLAESDDEIVDPIPRPRRASILYRRVPLVSDARPSGSASALNSGAWLANYDASQNYRLRVADGETGPAQWNPDGRTVLYLNYPAERSKLHNLREFTPDSKEDKMLAPTTQFVGFGANADASVFVGASGSKASPHVLLLVRAVQRELTLAEHRASDPKMVAPVFSPNSQRIFFSSDQHGKPAIYTMAVERLVEATDA
jgi:oligogalacturonide lyase